MVLHLHTYQHFSLPIARHAVCGLCDQLLLNQPTSRTKIGEQSFSCATPRAWNQLPIAVQQCTTVNHFKVALKTHLFTAYYFDSLLSQLISQRFIHLF